MRLREEKKRKSVKFNSIRPTRLFLDDFILFHLLDEN